MSPDPTPTSWPPDQAHAGDDALLYRWGGTSAARTRVATPLTDAEPVRQLRTTPRRGVISRGLGRAYGDAAQNAGGLVLDATALSGIIAADLERGVVTARAGTSLQDLMEWLPPAGWCPGSPGAGP